MKKIPQYTSIKQALLSFYSYRKAVIRAEQYRSSGNSYKKQEHLLDNYLQKQLYVSLVVQEEKIRKAIFGFKFLTALYWHCAFRKWFE